MRTAALSLMLSLATCSLWASGAADAAAYPSFVDSSLYPSGATLVFGVARTPVADIVLLENGFDQGFRLGAVCEVLQGESVIAEVILIEVREDRSAALIVQINPASEIRNGDRVRIKTL